MASLRTTLNIVRHHLKLPSISSSMRHISSSVPLPFVSPKCGVNHHLLRYSGYMYSGLRHFSTSCSSNPASSHELDISNDERRVRLLNRLLYRSRQRGFLELDLILGRWVEDNIHSMDENGIKALVDVLDMENADLWRWLTGQEPPSSCLKNNPVFCAIHEMVIKRLERHAAAETKAVPGQPWVTGWDEIKRGTGSPVAGNQ